MDHNLTSESHYNAHNMKNFAVITCTVFAASSALAHDGHDHLDQMPLDYVKYPYQAVAPGFTEGC